MTDLKLFIEKVRSMRQAQKDYFKDRDKDVLKESKRLEREVDAMIIADDNEIEGQTNLFDHVEKPII